MLADVAKPSGAQDRIGDGVEHDVGVAVSGQRATVRDGYASEHQRTFSSESVNVEPHARPHLTSLSRPKLFATATNCNGLSPQQDRFAANYGSTHPAPQIACVLLLLGQKLGD